MILQTIYEQFVILLGSTKILHMHNENKLNSQTTIFQQRPSVDLISLNFHGNVINNKKNRNNQFIRIIKQ